MVQYIVECIAFQLLFLIVYDLFLRRETFFQWNRMYLITTYILSLFLPWIRVDAFKNTVPEHIMSYPEIWMDIEETPINILAVERGFETTASISWWSILFYAGAVLSTILFFIKIMQLYRLRRKGEVTYFEDFTRVLVSKSNAAFSFFKTIFLGDEIMEKERQSIVEHELVHIKQKHSLDLLLFELFRIVNWFNPLVYVYQSRISELHEFIADAQVAKTRKKEQYQLLLSQVFQTEKISFINHFFKSSLIKKRIVMLQKAKSKKIWGAKYLLLAPLVLCILFYTSSKGQEKEVFQQEQIISDAELIKQVNLKIDKLVEEKGSLMAVRLFYEVIQKDSGEDVILDKEEFFERDLISTRMLDGYLKKSSALDRKRSSLLYPSTDKYNNYASRKKAFQKLDKNLKISFGQTNSKLEIIAPNSKISHIYKIINVENAKDLTGIEIREVNNTITDIFQNETYKGIVITDGDLAVKVTHEKLVENKAAKPKANKPNQDTDEVPFSVVDNVPVFPSCEDADDKKACFREQLQKHIRDNFRYPQSAQKQGIQGRVSIMFTIMEDGKIGRIRWRGPSKVLEQEAVRIIGELPKMQPGKHKGKKVRVPFSVPITFKLQTEKDLDPATLKHVRKQLEQMEREAKEKTNYGNVVPFSVIDDVPVFPGCEDAIDKKACFNKMMQKHIREHFRYPKEAQEKGIQGRVSVLYTIQKDGSIGNIRKRGPSEILENEAVRIIEKLPQMVPGKHKNENVKVPFSVPIVFKLNDNLLNTNETKANLDAMWVVATSTNKNGKRYLSGKVTNGELGLPGVNIIVKGENKGVVTNFDGKFTIEVKSGNVINFQYTGFPKTALVITDKEEYKIKSIKE